MREADAILAKEGVDNPGYDFEVPKTMIEHPELKPPNGSLFLDRALRVILGLDPLASYEEFIREWRRRGGETAIAEATAWYERRRRE